MRQVNTDKYHNIFLNQYLKREKMKILLVTLNLIFLFSPLLTSDATNEVQGFLITKVHVGVNNTTLTNNTLLTTSSPDDNASINLSYNPPACFIEPSQPECILKDNVPNISEIKKLFEKLNK